MFTIEHTPKYGDKVLYGNTVVTIHSFMGVIADALYGTKNAWASVENADGKVFMCSLYDLKPCDHST